MSDPSSTTTTTTDTSELEPAQRAFERGDYLQARRRATTARISAKHEVQKEATSLLDKMAADRAVYVLLAVSAIFLILAFVSYAGKQ